MVNYPLSYRWDYLYEFIFNSEDVPVEDVWFEIKELLLLLLLLFFLLLSSLLLLMLLVNRSMDL